MKRFVVLAVFLALAFSEEKASAENKEGQVKTYQRLIPADVLRDFPGACFASTRCATVKPGSTWELHPFCGRSTCTTAEGHPETLLELVEDCGPLPKANPKCKLDKEKTNLTAPFPECCPVFTCEPGAKLEYAEIPTIAPIPKAGEAPSSTPKA